MGGRGADASALVAAAEAAERELLRSDTRRDASRMRALLADDFREIGASGRVFDRESIIGDVLSGSGDVHPEISEMQSVMVASDLVLVTYRLDFGGRLSRRSSLWSVAGGQAQLRFHQGTPLS
ncbi:MAG: nuclear transport factor 2 family protein [Microcella sp.]